MTEKESLYTDIRFLSHYFHIQILMIFLLSLKKHLCVIPMAVIARYTVVSPGIPESGYLSSSALCIRSLLVYFRWFAAKKSCHLIQEIPFLLKPLYLALFLCVLFYHNYIIPQKGCILSFSGCSLFFCCFLRRLFSIGLYQSIKCHSKYDSEERGFISIDCYSLSLFDHALGTAVTFADAPLHTPLTLANTV